MNGGHDGAPGGLMAALERAERAVGRIAGVVSVVLLAAIVGVIVLQVAVRHVATQPVIWTEEVARYLLVWFTMIGAGWLGRTGAHMGLGMGGGVPSGPRARLTECALYAVGTAVLLYIAVTTFLAAGTFTGASAALRIPTEVVYLALPVGCSLWAVHSLLSLVRLARGGPAHQPDADAPPMTAPEASS
ncbi:TRAP transporter small permease [Pseudonocardia nematodicida]|uniref:TRAP transporter small permease n=1 Tax=Pseudonocardia nematodicida TaxID=1206997 RepID=A0ABV1KJI2_9PSEU